MAPVEYFPRKLTDEELVTKLRKMALAHLLSREHQATQCSGFYRSV